MRACTFSDISRVCSVASSIVLDFRKLRSLASAYMRINSRDVVSNADVSIEQGYA